MEDTWKIVWATVLGVVLLISTLFFTGFIGNVYDTSIGRQQINVQRENFERSQSYVHSKIDDLAKYKREYQRATSKEEKNQIRNFILDEFANFDTSLIDNPDLYSFLKEMENGK